MADKSLISWTDATWNVINGCSLMSPGCTNCFAQRLAGTRLKHHGSREGLTVDTKAGPVWNGEVRWWEPFYMQPYRWTKARRIFVCAHGDLFHEKVPDDWIDRVMAMAAICPRHTFQILTKRAGRLPTYFCGPWRERSERHVRRLVELPLSIRIAGAQALHERALPNVHVGVSAEDQVRADLRIPELLRAPVAVRWVSAEPLLGPIRFEPWVGYLVRPDMGFVAHGERELLVPAPRLDWVEAGGESGPGARPMHPQWARDIRDACAVAGVAFGFKQFGNWREVGEVNVSRDHQFFDAGEFRAAKRWPEALEALHAGKLVVADIGKHAAGRMLDGRTHDGLREARP